MNSIVVKIKDEEQLLIGELWPLTVSTITMTTTARIPTNAEENDGTHTN